MGRITALRDDLAYALAAREELRIIAPIPGKQAVGVEVPNPEASLVTLGDITREFPAHAGPLMAWLGLDLGGKPVYIDLARMPHLLIAGSTGTGKSVCLNALLASILLRSTPDEPADDPDRPQEGRAQPLREHPAPADARSSRT